MFAKQNAVFIYISMDYISFLLFLSCTETEIFKTGYGYQECGVPLNNIQSKTTHGQIELFDFADNTLFSKKPIPYKNLMDMCKQRCNPELPKNENAKIHQQAAWLTDAVTSDVIQQRK